MPTNTTMNKAKPVEEILPPEDSEVLETAISKTSATKPQGVQTSGRKAQEPPLHSVPVKRDPGPPTLEMEAVEVQAADQTNAEPSPEAVATKAAKLDSILAKDKAALSKPLSDAEKKKRDSHLALIVRAGGDAILASLALQEIRDRKLYRETHSDFDSFCRDVCEITTARASQLIAAAKEYAYLKDKVDPAILPTTEGALRKLRDVAEESKIEVLQLAAELSSQARPTGASIEQAWKQIQGTAPDTSPKKVKKTKPGRLLKVAKSTVEMLKSVDRESFTLGELAEMTAMLQEFTDAAKSITAK